MGADVRENVGLSFLVKCLNKHNVNIPANNLGISFNHIKFADR